MTTVPAVLEYAATPSPFRRRVRRVVYALLLIGAVTAAYLWGKPAWQKTRSLYWQRQCMTYAPPEDFIVYEEGPGAAALLARPGYLPHRAPLHKTPAAGFTPHCLTRLMAEHPNLAPGRPAIPVFMHEMCSKAGDRRLVVILHNPSDGFFWMPFDYSDIVLQPGTVRRPPTRSPRRMLLLCGTHGSDDVGRSLRIYAGKPDSSDSSRFSVRVERNGIEWLLAGELVITARHEEIDFEVKQIGVSPSSSARASSQD